MKVSGLKINFLGDSITEGAGASSFDNTYIGILNKQNIICRNYGIGGTRIARQQKPSHPQYDRDFCSRWNLMDEDADIVVVFGGTNDYGHGDAELGCNSDITPDTFYVDCGNLPLYSFRYGLSYSEFVYENMELSKNELSRDDKIKVRITILNDSKFKGKEVVMLYMHDLVASTARPIQQLIAFKKVEFEPNERKNIEFEIDESMLRFWNDENKFISEPGEFHTSTGYADHFTHTQSIFLK